MPQKEENIITDLYRKAASADEMDFRSYALEKLRSALSFDSASWIDCALLPDDSITVFSCLPFNASPKLGHDIRASLDENRLAKLSIHDLGSALIGDVSKVDPVTESGLLEMLLKHDLFYSILYNLIDPGTNLIHNICLYRKQTSKPFTKEEGLLVEQLIPDVIESYILYRRNQLNKQVFIQWQKKYSIAYSSKKGLLRDIPPQFVTLLQLEWPSWKGPILPEQLIAYFGNNEEEYFKGNHIMVRVVKAGDFHILISSNIGCISLLSEREQVVAEKFVSGKTYKDVADELHISPSTAKTHLKNIYRKLDVNSKTSLAEIMGRVFDG